MRLVETGGYIPVDMPHVVFGGVDPQVGEVDPGAPEHRAIGALQPSLEPADHPPLQAPQEPVGRAGHRSAILCRGFSGTGSEVKIRMSSSSAVTSSESAS